MESLIMLQVLSALSAFKLIKYLYAKFLYLFGLATNNPRLVETSSPLISESDIKQSARWPILLYLGLVFSAPFIIWRLLGPLVSQETTADWVTGQGEHYQATALHTFRAEREGELSLEAGEDLRLAPRHLQPKVRGWLLASSHGTPGLVPANYIQILGRREAASTTQPDIVQETARRGDSLDTEWAKQMS